ncbi:shikimate kinase [Enterococcus sp. CSURQ0835]|uniref:shikimate kinase n=1 Tax=Enterococcus sp. CSURQ0835 TaxID=2681394 RepID=UPI00135A8CE5|nr:shikimate kinase [Enterococcus sp. CSURQ0835]
MAIVLIGFMGAGKSTISRLLAKNLAQPFIDLDDELEKTLAGSIPDFFAEHGEAAFRKLETATLKQALQAEQIIATGGGIVTSQENRQLLKKEHVIYLKTQPEKLVARIREDQKTIRPLAETKTDHELLALFLARQAWYEEVASIMIETDQRTPAEIAQKIQEEVSRWK